jgi:hypothetical protein
MLDFSIAGADALDVGRAYDRQFDPRFLFDVATVDHCRDHFAAFAESLKKQAHLELLPKRIPHLERARLAIAIGQGAGVVQYNGLWAVAIADVPTDRSLPIFATPLPDGEFTGRWRTIDVVIDANAIASRSVSTEGVMVEHGQLLCSDLEAFGEFRMWQSLDGLADFVLWGEEAAGIARVFQAAKFGEREYGWKDLPIEEMQQHAQEVQSHIAKSGLNVGVDYRPHCNLEKLHSQIRAKDLEAGQVLLGQAKTCGFSNRWGDGIFEVVRDFDTTGRLIRIRLDVGNEKKQALLRGIRVRRQGAIVSRKILDERQPIRFAERLEPTRAGVSGWFFSAGTETDEYMSDADNMAVASIHELLQMDGALSVILGAPVGSVFRRTESGYVPEIV